MRRSEENQVEVILSRGDWEEFLSSLERLINLHQRTLQRVKDLATRNAAIRTELRSALSLPILEPRPSTDGTIKENMLPVQPCRYCAGEIATSARFCDICGKLNAAAICECGNELSGSDNFCDRCGRRVIAT